MRKVVPKSFPDEPVLGSPADLGRFVRAARTQSGLTLADAALAVGVSKQTLQDLEKGKPTVGLGLAMKIAHELGVSLFGCPAELKERTRRSIRGTV